MSRDSVICTFTCTVAFCRLASGEISAIIAVVLAIRKRVDRDDAFLFGAQLGEIVLRDIEFHLQIVQSASATTSPCGPPSAWLANCEVTSSPFSAVRSRIVPVTGARITVASSSDFAYASWPSPGSSIALARAISSARGPIFES